EVEWGNRLLDQQRVCGVAETTLRSYAYDLLHFLRWWAKIHHSTALTDKVLTESTLLDYIRFQVNQQPPPAAASINRRVGIAERALQLAFPHAQTPFLHGFQSGYWRPLPLGTGEAAPGAEPHARAYTQTRHCPLVRRSGGPLLGQFPHL